MTKLNIKRNPVNGGLDCFFTHGNKNFYADLCMLKFSNDSECMIFPSNGERVTSWNELYCRRGIPITKESLRECIEEFIETLDK